jgi:hypothetical protein
VVNINQPKALVCTDVFHTVIATNHN